MLGEVRQVGPENVKIHKGAQVEEMRTLQKKALEHCPGSGGRWAAEFWVPVGSLDSASLPESVSRLQLPTVSQMSGLSGK